MTVLPVRSPFVVFQSGFEFLDIYLYTLCLVIFCLIVLCGGNLFCVRVPKRNEMK